MMAKKTAAAAETDQPAEVSPLAALQSDYAKLQDDHQRQAAELAELRREHERLTKALADTAKLTPQTLRPSVRLVLRRDTVLNDVPKGIGTPLAEVLLEPGVSIETLCSRIVAGDVLPAATK